jgi:hypothetical protein
MTEKVGEIAGISLLVKTDPCNLREQPVEPAGAGG